MSDLILEQRLARELASNEPLLWSGRPRQGFLLRPADSLLIPFSLLWCGFAIFWEASAVTTNAPWFFKLWGIPFVIAGLHIVFGRFLVDIYQRQHTLYGVTSSRVIIVSGIFRESVQSLALRGLSDLSLSERPDGSGNVVLGPTSLAGTLSFQGWPGSRQGTSPLLEGIPQARVVHDLIRRAQSGSA